MLAIMLALQSQSEGQTTKGRTRTQKAAHSTTLLGARLARGSLAIPTASASSSGTSRMTAMSVFLDISLFMGMLAVLLPESKASEDGVEEGFGAAIEADEEEQENT